MLSFKPTLSQSPLLAYRTTVKTAMGFTLFHLVHGSEVVLPIECEIPTLHTALDLIPGTPDLEHRLLSLEQLDEYRRATLQSNEALKKRSKSYFNQHVNPRTFHESDLILAFDARKDKNPGPGK